MDGREARPAGDGEQGGRGWRGTRTGAGREQLGMGSEAEEGERRKGMGGPQGRWGTRGRRTRRGGGRATSERRRRGASGATSHGGGEGGGGTERGRARDETSGERGARQKREGGTAMEEGAEDDKEGEQRKGVRGLGAIGQTCYIKNL